ncbi:MAG: DNA polymerase I [Longimicrobiales bacterium]|nr:DNA polymerase I [Longimicrobiales bacterium]
MKIPEKTRPRLFLIDAYALIYRAYFAFIQRPLTNSRGENTSAAFGFARFLEDLRDTWKPDYLAIVFDAGDSFRDEMYEEYKATREKMPDDLRASLAQIRRMVEAYNDPVIELEGYEADDVIGTLSLQAKTRGIESVIVSGDKDFYQLIDEDVVLLNPGRGGPTGVATEWVGLDSADRKFGIPPSQVVDYLALIGDSADNVPGAPGVGPKTASKLLERYGTLEEIFEHADEISGKRAREAFTEHADQVRLSKKLVTIMRDLEIELDLDALTVHEPDAAALRDIFLDLEFRTLAERYAEAAQGEAADVEGAALETERTVALDAAAIDEIAATAREAGTFAISSVLEGDALDGRVIGTAVAVGGEGRADPDAEGSDAPGAHARSPRAWYLPFAHRAPGGALTLDLGDTEEDGVPRVAAGWHDPLLAPLRELLEDPALRVVTHDLKRELLALERAGVTLAAAPEDAMIASYVLDPGRRSHGLDELAMEVLVHRATPLDEVTGKGRKRVPFAEVELEAAAGWACERAEIALRLHERFAEQLAEAEGLARLYAELELPLVPVLAAMEGVGVAIDPDFFAEMSDRVNGELERVRERIFAIAGVDDFNLNSTPQLREVLFERLGLPVIKRTRTGPSTDATVLEELAADGHEVPRRMLEYRELEKLRSTYVDALPRLVRRETGRLHTSFNQTVAATGRLSSSEPNLQNIPIRTELGREIRRGFVAPEGHLLLGVDYSQIELRVLAHFSGDEAFVTAFREGQDVHRRTASVIFDVPVDEVTDRQRAQAKTINFATLYGQGAFSLARHLGVPRGEAQAFIDDYFERFAGVRTFLDAQVEQAREVGYVETLMGRRRYIPELKSGNWNIRQFGERVAQNTPIQGTAADLIKEAMLDVDAALSESGTAARMLLQVHDELLFEVPEAEVEAVREIVVDRMERAVALEVPVVAEAGAGRTWYDAKG